MEVRNAPSLRSVVDVPRAESIEALPFLALGSAPSLVPNMDFNAGFGEPCAGIILLDSVDPTEVAAALDAAPDPAVPIADFGRNEDIRNDFVGEAIDPASIAALRQGFAPILHRLREMPFRSAHEDRAEMTVLRLAYSRDTAIEARFDPDSRNIVEYPLLGRAPVTRQRLELLADLDLLRRQHFTRTHLCRRCDSARLHATEVCAACDSADLMEEPIVHHYRCGWQEPESRFAGDRVLVCPKCHRELRHYGVDYDKPGTVVVCRCCGKANAEPAVHFTCLDCAAVTPTNEAKTVDWYRYDLTEDGLRSLRDGRIPHADIADHLDGRHRAFSPREFRLLANEAIQVARRYGRSFTLGRIMLADVDQLRGEHGAVAVDSAFHLIVDVLIESLRASDFVGGEGNESVLIGFPETSKETVALILDRMSNKIKKVAPVPIHLTVDAADGEEVARLLAQEPIR
jgi:GGDEF domain-containing protein